jgi:alpha-1,6-mannosyltransferase
MVEETTKLRGPRWVGIGAHLLLALLVVSTGAALLNPSVSFSLPALLIAFVSFALLLFGETRRPALSRRLVIASIGLLFGLAVAVPPRQSKDIWSYAIYGRIVAVHHADPYGQPPASFGTDPWLERVSSFWREQKSVYGPVFTAVSALGMWLAGESPERARLFFQLLSALAITACLLVLDRTRREVAALVFLGLNPVIVVSVVNGGHNDSLLGLAVLSAVLAVRGGRMVLAGVALGLGALVKLFCLIPAAGLALWTLARRGTRQALAVSAAVAVTVTAGYLAAGGVSALEPVLSASRRMSLGSIWTVPRRAMTVGLMGQGFRGAVAGGMARQRIAILGGAAVLVVAAVLIASRLRGPPEVSAGAPALSYFLLGTYVVPWYSAWTLPALALSWRSGIALLTVAHSFALVVLVLPGLDRELPVIRDFLETAVPVAELLAAVAIVFVSVRLLLRARLRDRVEQSPVASGEPTADGRLD